MTNIDFSPTDDTSAIVDSDQVPTINIETGSDIPKTRNLGQLREWMGVGATGTTGGVIASDMQYVTPLGNVTATIASETDVHVDSVIRPPDETRAAQIRLVIQDTGTVSYSFADWSALVAINGGVPPAGGLTDTNSLVQTVAGINFRLAKANNVVGAANNTDEYFAFAATQNGDFVIGMQYVQLALEPYADRNDPNEDVPFGRLPIPEPQPADNNKVLTANATGGYNLLAPQTGRGTGGSDELSVRSTIPAIAGFSLGDIVNVNGDLYELVASTVDPNVYRGVIAANAGGDTNYFGDATFRWQTETPFNMRANFSRTPIGPSPPGSLWIRFHSGDEYADIKLDYASARDTATTFGYVHSPGTPGLEANSVGADFDITVYNNDAYSRAQNIQSANRWEKDNRNQPRVNPIAIVGNTDRWDYPKLPSDVAKSADIPHFASPTSFNQTYPGWQLNPTSQNRFVGDSTLLSPTLDLDDHAAGELHATLVLTLTAASDTNAGFTANDSSHRRYKDEDITLASDIAALRTFSTAVQTATAVDALGVKAFRVPVYSVNTEVGIYNLLFVKDANNQVGVYYYWSGLAGSTSYTITANLRVTFWPTDTGIAGGRNTRGTLQATSNTLPTSPPSGEIRTVRWTLPAASSMTIHSQFLNILTEPYKRAQNNQNGWWLVSEVGGVEFEEVFLGMNSKPNNQPLYFSSTQSVNFVDAVNFSGLRADRGSGTLPANARIKVYMAVT